MIIYRNMKYDMIWEYAEKDVAKQKEPITPFMHQMHTYNTYVMI